MIHAASRSDNMVIELQDAKNALADLLEVEAVMPKIFESMTSDTSYHHVIIDIAHQFMQYYVSSSKPVPHHILTQFISRKAKPYEIVPILKALVEQKYIKEIASPLKLPGGGGPKFYVPGETLQ